MRFFIHPGLCQTYLLCSPRMRKFMLSQRSTLQVHQLPQTNVTASRTGCHLAGPYRVMTPINVPWDHNWSLVIIAACRGTSGRLFSSSFTWLQYHLQGRPKAFLDESANILSSAPYLGIFRSRGSPNPYDENGTFQFYLLIMNCWYVNFIDRFHPL